MSGVERAAKQNSQAGKWRKKGKERFKKKKKKEGLALALETLSAGCGLVQYVMI